MTEENITTAPQNGQAPNTTPPSQGQEDGQGEEQLPVQDTQDSLPEKFKGKSATEIAKSYLELEKQLGKHSTEVSTVRKQLQQWEALGNILESDPELYAQVEKAINKISGKNSDTTVNGQESKRDDTRIALQEQIINKFEEQFAIQSLPPEKRTQLRSKIATELKEMVDPTGEKKFSLEAIPLNRLPVYLEKAYRLASSGDREEKARFEALIEARQNSEASFGNSPSSSISVSKKQLNEEEKKVARRMGISEEEYLKNKIALQEE